MLRCEKKHLLLLCCCLLWFASLAWSDEPDYRLIQQDQLWQGQIELQQAVKVLAGAELTIAPGTRVQVANKSAVIRIEGRLQAIGRADAPIVFQSPEGWLGIELYQSDGLNRFAHLQVRAAAVGLSSSLSRFEMEQSRFTDCETAIKLYRQADPLIVGSEFANNRVALAVGTRSQVRLLENRFHDNGTAVVASHNSSGTLRGNRFVANEKAVHLQNLFPGQLRENQFERNDSAVLCDQTADSPQIEENRFVDNRQGIVSLQASKPQVRRNRFERNQVALLNKQLGSPVVVQNLFVGNQVAIQNQRRSSPTVEHNHFEANGLALLCDYLSYPQVKQNNFVDNRLAVKLGDHQSAAMEQRGVSRKQLQQYLAESGKQGRMAVFTPVDGIVDVSENWWGGDVQQQEQPLFYARQQEKWVLDDTTGERYLRDVINYSPWLQQPVKNAGVQ